jgi:hypothetical protein
MPALTQIKPYFTSRTGMSEICSTLVAVKPSSAFSSAVLPRVNLGRVELALAAAS